MFHNHFAKFDNYGNFSVIVGILSQFWLLWFFSNCKGPDSIHGRVKDNPDFAMELTIRFGHGLGIFIINNLWHIK